MSYDELNKIAQELSMQNQALTRRNQQLQNENLFKCANVAIEVSKTPMYEKFAAQCEKTIDIMFKNILGDGETE